MSDSFWQQLDKPIVGLAPMDGITDQPFRHITKKYGNPDVIYTEFTSVEGVCHGAEKLLKDFDYDQSQRPIVAQIYGKTPEYFRQTAVILCELGFDGIDINMGCPSKNVASSGAGAALIQTPKLAQDIISQTKAGVQDFSNGKRTRDCQNISQSIWTQIEQRATQILENKKQRELRYQKELPVSVKTRIGIDKPVTEEWIPVLLEMEPAAIALHGRTLRQAYRGQADWQQIAIAAQLVNQTETLILGNGDVSSRLDAAAKAQKYNVDGVLIGRAAFGNPFVFSKQPPTDPIQRTKQLIQIALEHAQLYEQTYAPQEKYFFLPMRKHLAWYIKGIPQAKQIRTELMQVTNTHQVEEIFTKYLASYKISKSLAS